MHRAKMRLVPVPLLARRVEQQAVEFAFLEGGGGDILRVPAASNGQPDITVIWLEGCRHRYTSQRPPSGLLRDYFPHEVEWRIGGIDMARPIQRCRYQPITNNLGRGELLLRTT